MGVGNFYVGAMGGKGRGAKTQAALFDRFQKHLKSLSFSSNNITKQREKLIHFTYFSAKIYQKMICYGKDNKTKKGKEMIKDNNRRVLKF